MRPFPHGNIIDLHCDTLTECYKQKVGLQNVQLHFSIDRLPRGYRLCQCMAIFMPDELRGRAAEEYFDRVYRVFCGQLKEHGRTLCQVRDPSKIQQALEDRRLAVVLTVEGGSALGGKLSNLDRLHRLGVRMITLTWNAANEICGGAATDEGFTSFGRQVVRRMEQLHMAVDVSHLSDRGFYELCEFATRPFLASHSNARAVCAHRRNLTDDMFRILMKQGGIAGLNYYTVFIKDGGNTRDVADLLRHVHHFLALGGENALALGSDFDGADLPPYLDDVSRLEYLAEQLLRSGISEAVAHKILYQNARDYFVRLMRVPSQGEQMAMTGPNTPG